MSFSSIQITAKGRALLARAQTGTIINFTHIKMGDGSMAGQNIDEMADVINQKASLNINSLKVLTGGKAKVSSTFTNQGLSTGFYWRELAVFASDPDNSNAEIMYCYGNAGALADYIPAEGSQILERVISVLTIISNAANVTATIDSSNVYVTVQDAEATYTKKNDFNAHLSDYVRQPGYAVTTGSANTYSVTLNPAPTAYVDGMGIVVKIHAANTGASTINASGLGAKGMVDSKGNAPRFRLNGTYSLKYNSTSGNFILQGEGGEIPKLPNLVKNGNLNGLNAFNVFNMSSITTSGNIVSFTGNGQYARIEQMIPIKNGHKYYICGSLKATSNAVTIVSQKNSSPWNTLVSAAVTGTNNMDFVSAIGTSNEDANDYGFRIMDNRASGWTNVQGKQLMMIDLTEAYGAGNEPTKAEMDAVVQNNGNWWDSNLSLLTADANATIGDVLQDKVFYSAGNKLIGTIPVKTPDILNQVNAIAAISGTNSGDGQNCAYLQFTDVDKFFQGARWVRSIQPDLLPQNIVYGKSVFGQTGTFTGKGWYKSTGSPSYYGAFMWDDGSIPYAYGLEVSLNLNFTPKTIIIWRNALPSLHTLYSSEFEIMTATGYQAIYNPYVSHKYVMDGTYAYLRSSGFRMPVTISNGEQYTFLILG